MPVAITLRIPPPLDTPLSVVHEQDQIRVYAHGTTLVADGTPAEVAPDDLPPVTFAAAERDLEVLSRLRCPPVLDLLRLRSGSRTR